MFWFISRGCQPILWLFIFIVWLANMLVGWVPQIDNKEIISAAF